jgi:hypothetical protein
MRILKSPLAGTKFRRGGDAILRHLPAGAQLRLEPEPSNEYDPDAIRVLLPPSEIPTSEFEALRTELAGFALDLEGDVLAQEALFLGYISSSSSSAGKKALAATPGSIGNAELRRAIALAGVETPDAQLGFAENGWPVVLVTLPGGES